MGTANDEHLDVIAECLHDALVNDARNIERLRRSRHKGNHVTAYVVLCDARRKLAALEFLKQQGWEPMADFTDRSHHWEGIVTKSDEIV